MADVITRLKLESGEYDSKIKRATQGLLQMENECRKVGGTLAVLEKDQKQYVQSLGQMQTVSNTARGKLGELKQAFVELSAQYKRLTDEEKNGDFGRALKQSLDQLKTRTLDSKAELQNIEKEIGGASLKAGDFSSVLGDLGSKLGINGDLLGMVTTGTVGMTAAITAGTAAVAAATKVWADYNSELAKQDQITTVTTGLKGGEADNVTDSLRAIASTYDVDFREAVNTANVLMTQFGETSDNALQLIRDGMQGMIQGDGPKLLSMVQQFAPSFRDAGVSASQLIAVVQNSEGGLFSEQNMNAILMGIKNIRLMTDSTSEALARLGIDGQEMTRKMSDGSMTVFEALQQVSKAIEGANASSKEAGAVMQQVFGRQGAMQGMKLGRAIAELNTNLEETKKQTGEVGQSLADLEKAQEGLNAAMRETFQMNGWEEMGNKIETHFVEKLTKVVKGLGVVIDNLDKLQVAVNAMIPGLEAVTGAFSRMGIKGEGVLVGIERAAMNALGPIGMLMDALDGFSSHIVSNSVADMMMDRLRQQYNNMMSRYRGLLSNGLFGGGGGTTPIHIPKAGGKGGGGGSTKLTPAQQAEANMAKAEATYTNALADAEQKVIVGLMTEEDLQKTKLKLLEQIADANLNAWHLSDNDKYLTSFVNFANAAVNLRDNLMSVDEVFKQLEKDFPTLSPAGIESQSFAEGFASTAAADMGFKNEADTSSFIQNLVTEGMKNGVDMSGPAATLMEKLFEGMEIPDEELQAFVDELNEKLAELGIEPIKVNIDTKTIEKDAKVVDKSWNHAAQSIGQVASAISQLENPAAKIIGTIGQAVATIALSYAKAVKDAEEQGGPWAWIAFAATGLATMVSMISGIHSATGYAQGGIIKGNSYSGDNIGGLVDGSQLVGLNAGEVVLNHAQTETLANTLENGQQGGTTSIPYVMGEQIYLGLKTFLGRTGRGELVTTKMK